MTLAENVVDQGWYWVMKTLGPAKWEIMQAHWFGNNELEWAEVMINYPMPNSKISMIGDRIKEPE